MKSIKNYIDTYINEDNTPSFVKLLKINITPKKGSLFIGGFEIKESKKTIECTKKSVKYLVELTKYPKKLNMFAEFSGPGGVSKELSPDNPIINNFYSMAVERFYNKPGKYKFLYDANSYHDIMFSLNKSEYSRVLVRCLKYVYIPLIMLNIGGPQKYQGNTDIKLSNNYFSPYTLSLLKLFEHDSLTIHIGGGFGVHVEELTNSVTENAFNLPSSNNLLKNINISRESLPSINQINVVMDDVDIDLSAGRISLYNETYFGVFKSVTDGFNKVKELNIQTLQNCDGTNLLNIPDQVLNLSLINVEKVNVKCRDKYFNLTGMLYQYFTGESTSNFVSEYKYLTSDEYLNRINLSEINFSGDCAYIINQFDYNYNKVGLVPYKNVEKITLSFKTYSNFIDPFLLQRGVLPNLKTIIINNVSSDGKTEPFKNIMGQTKRDKYNIYDICKEIKRLRPDIEIKSDNDIFIKKLNKFIS